MNGIPLPLAKTLVTTFAYVWVIGSIIAAVYIYRPNPGVWIVANRRRAIITFVVVFIGARAIDMAFAWTVYIRSPKVTEAPKAPLSGSSTPPTASSNAEVRNSVEVQQPANSTNIDENITADAQVSDPMQEARESPFHFLKLTGQRYSKGGFGIVSLVSGKIVNSGPLAYKDAVLRCEYKAESGTIMGVAEPRVYQTFPAHSTKRLINFNAGYVDSQSVQASCIIEDAKPISPTDK